MRTRGRLLRQKLARAANALSFGDPGRWSEAFQNLEFPAAHREPEWRTAVNIASRHDPHGDRHLDCGRTSGKDERLQYWSSYSAPLPGVLDAA